jgi:hypothetical protein
MEPFKIALFGEAEKGDLRTPYYCQTLKDLVEFFGEPPKDSFGLHFAVQSLLYHFPLIFFRVQQEGFSHQDYLIGLDLLRHDKRVHEIKALGFPGVGDKKLINAATPLCREYRQLLILREVDLYDFLTN